MEDGVDILERNFGEPRVAGKLPGAEAKIFPSRDYRAIRALAQHPRIFPQISDDFTEKPADWKLIESEFVTYLLASDEKGPFGFGIFIPRTWACWDSHMGFLPRSYGNLAQSSFKQMLGWMWQNTSARRIVGEIRRDNLLAIRFARRAGYEIFGMNRKSYLKGGKLVDQACLGISKP